MLGEIISFRENCVEILPYSNITGIPIDATVINLNRQPHVPCGMRLLGRVLDGLGRPIDSKGDIRTGRLVSHRRHAPDVMSRPPITKPFITGQRVIDGLLTCGQGQRIGLFAGGGVGKSTLLGEIARHAVSDVNVIALIGERAREVRPFIDDTLGPEGLRRSVVVVASADDPPIARVRAAWTAVTIANWFRQQGKNVLFLFDSLTRLAMAQREVGLSLGEPPSARGYPPSAFQVLSGVLEQLGTSEAGVITGILTVLVDGDDMDEPVSDAVRAILDGHIVMSRKLAEKGHYPAIDVGQSVSRLFREVSTPTQRDSASFIRNLLATYNEVAELINIGAYKRGTSEEIDRSIRLYPVVQQFLKQKTSEFSEFQRTLRAMDQIVSRKGT